jgi:hypothetical protein
VDIAKEARAAYILGWAETGGSLTDRVKAGCAAAVACCDTPDLLEVTLQIGKLEGRWALIHSDREEVHAHHGGAITRAWRKLLKATVDVPAGVRTYLADVAPGHGRTQRRVAAQAVANGMLAAVEAPQLPEYDAMIAALMAAIRTAEKAGIDAGKLLCDTHETALTPDPPGPDQDHDRRDLALAALALIRRGTATDLARALVTAGGNDPEGDEPDDPGGGDPDDDAVYDDAVTSLTSGEKASGRFSDLMIGGSFIQGMIAAFVSAGRESLNWISMGDGRVCPICEGYEDGSPYSLTDVPAVPHISCRCVVEPN